MKAYIKNNPMPSVYEIDVDYCIKQGYLKEIEVAEIGETLWIKDGACFEPVQHREVEQKTDYEKMATELMTKIMAKKEEILEAFIAETGLKPSECEMVRDGLKWFVRKREDKSYVEKLEKENAELKSRPCWKTACANLCEKMLLAIPMGDDGKQYDIYNRVLKIQTKVWKDFINPPAEKDEAVEAFDKFMGDKADTIDYKRGWIDSYRAAQKKEGK